ncbi:hypothetical protein [Streptomyces sp. KL2]|uniref:hypothetical protein n=1 Tax=Streptomyces sp. KL2 TaxID=3050126 RepID=UPI0039784221
MGTPGSASEAARAAAVRRHPRPATVLLLALYAAAAAVGLAAGGTAEGLLGSALLAAVALRLVPYHRTARRPRDAPRAAAGRSRAAGGEDAADA